MQNKASGDLAIKIMTESVDRICGNLDDMEAMISDAFVSGSANDIRQLIVSKCILIDSVIRTTKELVKLSKQERLVADLGKIASKIIDMASTALTRSDTNLEQLQTEWESVVEDDSVEIKVKAASAKNLALAIGALSSKTAVLVREISALENAYCGESKVTPRFSRRVKQYATE